MKKLVMIICLLSFVTVAFSQVVPTPYYSKSKRKIINNRETKVSKLDNSRIQAISSFINLDLKNINIFKINDSFSKQKKAIDDIYDKQKTDLLTWRIDTIQKIINKMRSVPNYSTQGKIDVKSIFDQYKSKKEEITENQHNEYEIAYYGWEEDNRFRFLPVRNRVCGALYYNSKGDKAVESLKNGFLKFGNNGTSIYSELIAGYGGPFRFSFGGMIAGTNITKIDSAVLKKTPLPRIDSLVKSIDSVNKVNNSIQRLIGGGGNAVFVISTPILDYHDYQNYFKASLIAFDKICFDIPSLNNQLTNGSMVNGFGLESDASYSFQNENVFGAFGSLRATILNGSNQFYENLGVKQNKTLIYSELILGIYLYQFKIYYNKNWINESTIENTMHWSVGVSVTPFGN